MKLATKERYALSAMLELAACYQQTIYRQAAQIANQHDIPISYLEQILLKLKHKELIISTRGPCGGYRLSRPPSEINIYDILRSPVDPYTILDCLHAPDACNRSAGCPTRPFWQKLNCKMTGVLKSTTLADLMS